MRALPGNQLCCPGILSKRVKHKSNVIHEHPRNLGPILPKTLLGQVGHPGPSADLLPDLLPARQTTSYDLFRIWRALPTSPSS